MPHSKPEVAFKWALYLSPFHNAAIRSSSISSARAIGEIPAASIASVTRPASNPAVRRFFPSVFRFCAKPALRNPIKPSASTPNSANRGRIVSRSTVECTSGGGENASGGSVSTRSTRAYNCAVADSSPYSRVPGVAATRSATSRCTITTARAIASWNRNSRSRISDVM